VTAADGHYAAATSTGEGDQLLNLRDGLWADIELRAREERLGPGVVEVIGRRAEWNRIVEPRQLTSDRRVHDVSDMR
jgi:hypothetical protein